MDASNERTTELRQMIRDRVTSQQVQEKIRECVSDANIVDGGADDKEATLLRLLEKKGIIDEVMTGLDLPRNTEYVHRPVVTRAEDTNACNDEPRPQGTYNREGAPPIYLWLYVHHHIFIYR